MKGVNISLINMIYNLVKLSNELSFDKKTAWNESNTLIAMVDL